MAGSVKQRRNPCSGPSPVYQDLSTYHDWPVTKDIAVGTASQMLLTEVKLHLRRRLCSNWPLKQARLDGDGPILSYLHR